MQTKQFDPSRFVFPSAPVQRRGLVQNRLQNFGLTLVVMGASFILYYLGLFGGVQGPLEPKQIGDRLAALGFSDRHLLILLLSLTVVAIIWNWIYNAVNRMLGRQVTCAFQSEDGRNFCARPIVESRSDFTAGRFICTAGHDCPNAHVRVLKKGTVGHFMWMMLLVFSVMVFYLTR